VRSDKPANRTLRPLVWARYFAFWLVGNLLRNKEAPPSLVQTVPLPDFFPYRQSVMQNSVILDN
jgi:hypothetical protein